MAAQCPVSLNIKSELAWPESYTTRRRRAAIHEITERVGHIWELVSFHVRKMESVGLVEGTYSLNDPSKKPPRAVKDNLLTGKDGRAFIELSRVPQTLFKPSG